MADQTARIGLPFLYAGQAQKEITHNEALQRLDACVQSVVEDERSTPPATPEEGKCWIVGTAPTGAWEGHAGAIAQWTGGGWRFVLPFEGFAIWSRGHGVVLRHIGGVWSGAVNALEVRVGGLKVVGAQQAGIIPPAGGSVSDVECRASVAAIITVLQAHGLISH